GRLSVLSVAQGISARRIAERNARCRVHNSHTDGRRTICYEAEHCHLKRSRTSRTSTGVVSGESVTAPNRTLGSPSTRRRRAEQSEAFAWLPSRLDARCPRAAWASSARASDR